ncbi:MAG: serine hydrolase [Patescibacteria group bacterium]
MPHSGWLFTALTVIGIAGAGTLLGAEVLKGASVSAQPLAGAGMLRLPVSGMVLKSVDPRTIFIEPLPPPPPPAIPIAKPDAAPTPALTAKSALVIDSATGTALFEKDADTAQSIASITKLLTAIIITDSAPDWSATSTMQRPKGIDGPHVLEQGDVVTLRDLLFASLVGSSNSATLSLVDAVAPKGSSFVARMRLAIGTYGLSSMRLEDAAGLSAENRATARDVVRLLQMALERPLLREALGSARYEVRTTQGAVRQVTSTNWVLLGKIPLKVSKMIGSKTGYLPEAGYNFVTAVEDGRGHVLYVAVLGAKDHYARFTEAQALAEWAYRAFEWK